jgi:tRNA threonylcarbamoyladenosine biosynthesis protein TsaE
MMFHVSLDALPEFASRFWEAAGAVKVFAFHGPMGAGKTTLITALGRFRGVADAMSSPTFSIINHYVFEEGGREQSMYHIDLYRLERADEALQAGVEDAVYSGGICMVEWPEKAPELFDETAAHVYVETAGAEEGQASVRLVRMELPNSRTL